MSDGYYYRNSQYNNYYPRRPPPRPQRRYYEEKEEEEEEEEEEEQDLEEEKEESEEEYYYTQDMDQILKSIAKHIRVECGSTRHHILKLVSGQTDCNQCSKCNQSIDETQYIFLCPQEHRYDEWGEKHYCLCIECAGEKIDEMNVELEELNDTLNEQLSSKNQQISSLKSEKNNLNQTIKSKDEQNQSLKNQLSDIKKNMDQTLKSFAKHFPVKCKSHSNTSMVIKSGGSGRCDGCNKNIGKTQPFFKCKSYHNGWRGNRGLYCIECAGKEYKDKYEENVKSLKENEKKMDATKVELTKAQKEIADCKRKEQQNKMEIDTLNQTIISLQSDNKTHQQKVKRFEDSSSIHLLNKIINDDEIEVECKEDINKGISFEKYQNIFNDHEKIMKKWNQNTKKLKNITTKIEKDNDFNINENNDDEKMNEYNNQLYHTFILSQKMMNEQSKRLHNIGADHHIKELMSTQNQLSRQIEANHAHSTTAEEEREASTNKYGETQQKRIRLNETIEDKVNECNDSIKQENELLVQIKNKQHLMNLLKEQQEKLESSSAKCVSLIDAYIEFTENNKKYIKAMNKYFDTKWTEFESKWHEWESKDIISWFMYKTYGMDTNNVKWDHVQKEMKKRNINGASLEHFNDSRLDMIGIHDFKIAVCLMKEITTLRNKYSVKDGDQDNDKQNQQNNTKIPSKFVCPITKKIMSDPVIAFDENNYEREAIVKYLKEKGTSPITGRKAFRLYVFSNDALRKEIEAYCALNEIYNDEGQEDETVDIN